MTKRLPHISVDFNNTTEEGFIFARHARASDPLSEGAAVLAMDEDGHTCGARVERVIPEGVFLNLATDTWADPTTTDRETAIAAYHAGMQLVQGTVLVGDEEIETIGALGSANLILDR